MISFGQALRRAAHIVVFGKDATAGDVHVSTALGNDGKKRRRRLDRAPPGVRRVRTRVRTLKDDSFSIPLAITKFDPDQQLIFGWASVVEEDGNLVVDKQGDVILPEDLEKAAYDFVLYARKHGDMHDRVGTGRMIESMVFTKDKQEALGINIGKVGWWVGFKVDDDELWAAHKRGERPEFSIGGTGTRKELDDFDKTLPANASAKDWIDDFQASNDPRFKGKSQDERRRMAIAAYESNKTSKAASFNKFLVDPYNQDWPRPKEAQLRFPFDGWLRFEDALKYSADQPRDAKGEWTAGGQSDAATAAMALHAFQAHEAGLAPDQNFTRVGALWTGSSQEQLMRAGLTSPATSDEKSAVGSYSRNRYRDINSGLRGVTVGSMAATDLFSTTQKETVDNLDSLLAKASLPQDMVVYRGIMSGSAWDQMSQSKSFTDPGFVSTSLQSSWSSAFGGEQLEIHLPAGSPALVLDGLSRHAEGEVLIARGSTFNVLGVDPERANRLRVELAP